MAKKLPHELLLDSEASLRLADNLLVELREEPSVHAGQNLALSLRQDPGSVAQLPQILLRAYAEINNVLDSLRRSRVLLERTTADRVQRTQEQLRDVTSATEVATIDLLDGVDQALGLVDRLDGTGSARPSETAAAAIRTELRDRLYGLVTSLQFQDITAQQLSYASVVLEDVETRMHALAELIDHNLVGHEDVDCEDTPDPPSGCDDVHTLDPVHPPHARTRQALADAIFSR